MAGAMRTGPRLVAVGARRLPTRVLGGAALGADSLRTTSPPIALSEHEELMRREHLS